MNDKCIKEEIKVKILKFPEINKNEKTIYQNLQETLKTLLIVKFTPQSAYIK